MSMVEVAPHAHRIGSPVMLTHEDIVERRECIERKYGTRQALQEKRDFIGLTLDERIALQDLKDLDFLEGRR